MRRAEEKYRSIFENAVEGMFQTSPDGRYLSANPALAKIYGYDSAEEMMTSLSDIGAMLYLDSSRREDFRRLVEYDGIVVNFESEVRRRDGVVIWISENARAIRDADGRVVCYEGTVIDVTSRREAVAMQAQVDAAEAANRAKSEFLANMSHEIRTPLNGVMGMLELLGTTPLDDRQSRFVRLARSSSDALLALINQILDFSKIEAGCIELEHVEFQLRPLIEDLAEVLGHRANSKGIELACRIHANVPDVVAGDPERLRQVLVNLTNNAVKFTETGRVEIDVSYDDAGDWRPRFRFEVRDTGIGVPANRRDRLFQPFSQVDASTTRKYGGTGLGLSICKQLVEVLGGRIVYDERPGGGSIFRFDLPLEVRNTPSPSLPRVVPKQWRDLRVLAVDDVDVNRELLDEHLRGWGVALDTAPDAATALQLVRQAATSGSPYQLVLLDRKLPDMDGLDLAGRIHAVADHADAQLLLLTSISESPERDELRRLGISDVLYKPLRQSSLFDALMTLTGHADAVVAPAATSSTTSEIAGDINTKQNNTATGGLSILVADDNEVNRLVTAEILRTAGHRSTLVTNGREAVDAAIGGGFDLILMDCQMPVLDGFSAVAELRQRESAGESFHLHGPVPILALTANAVRGDRERCLGAGMNGYVSKPIDRLALLAEIYRCVPAETLAAQTATTTIAAPATIETNDDAETATAGNDSLRIEELLDRCQGDREFAGRVLAKFRQRLPQELDELTLAATECDHDRAAKVAHQLKGCAGNVGAAVLHRRAAELELSIVAGMTPTTDELADLRRDAEACLETIAALLEEFQKT